MESVDFSSKASRYNKTSLVQKAAGDRLIELLSIHNNVDVLDLGCGSGGITSKIAALTSGKVLGLDLSEGMIDEARRRYNLTANLGFMVGDVAELEFTDEFDRIYCNSAFQWFIEPRKTLTKCYKALKPGGLMGIQATATEDYCPQFLYAVRKLAKHPRTSEIFASFISPWLFLNDADEYGKLFEGAGFSIEYSRLATERSLYTVDQAYGVFQSGAENGYLNQAYYMLDFDKSYVQTCRSLIKTAFHDLADEKGMVELTFNRVYLIVRKD